MGGEHLPRALNDVVGPAGEQRRFFAVAIQHGTRFDPGSPSGLHIRWGISYQEALPGSCTQYRKRRQNHVRRGFRGESISALHVIEVR